jgi:Ino eighty subunit 1
MTMASSSVARSPDQQSFVGVWQPNQRPPYLSCPPPPNFHLPFIVPSTTQYVARKAQPIKRVDSEPLWRKDIQYDFLYYVFTDRTRAFVDYQAPDRPVVNFCDLYVNALYNSSKCSKVLKDKMVETPEFAIEFAKISLLTNVGRINTTMACEFFFLCFMSHIYQIDAQSVFPEMKTALRSYHPVPSLQKTDGNLQDAPRIKNCLKAALLPFETKGNPPSTPTAIIEKAVRVISLPHR